MMNRMVVLNLMSALVAVLTTGVVLADQVSGPFKHGNLEIYLLRSAVGAPQPKHDYVPVGAALASGRLRISESGTVGHLVVENTGDRPVFFHVGDLLTGGNQDRAVSRSVVVRPGSGPTTVAVLCVEAGRWGSGSAGFAASGIRLPYATEVISRGQFGVWDSVSEYQRVLGKTRKASLIDPSHPTSLPRTLRNLPAPDPKQGKASEQLALDGATGYVAVMNGRVVAAERFGSAEMLARTWSKAMRSAAVASMLQSSGSGNVTSITDVQNFLEQQTKAGQVTDYFAGPGGTLLHRVYNTVKRPGAGLELPVMSRAFQRCLRRHRDADRCWLNLMYGSPGTGTVPRTAPPYRGSSR